MITSKPVDVSRAQVLDALQTLTGNIAQIPPMHSALKFEGKRLYQLARKGMPVNNLSITCDRVKFISPTIPLIDDLDLLFVSIYAINIVN